MADAYGPVDFLILEYPPDTDGTATARALTGLIDRGVVALYDLMVVRREPDGTAREIDLASGSADVPAAFATFAGARSGLLGADDVDEAANALEPGASAVVIVYENRWAAPFVSAARAEGVEVVASARLTAQEIMDALDEVEAAS
jgi:hypothetical protein